MVMAEGEGSGTAGAFSETQVKAVQAIFQQMLDERLEAREVGTARKGKRREALEDQNRVSQGRGDSGGQKEGGKRKESEVAIGPARSRLGLGSGQGLQANR